MCQDRDHAEEQKIWVFKADRFIDMEEYRTYQIEFYNRRGDLEKILTFSDYRLYMDKFWRAHQMDMNNEQTGKSTSLVWDSYEFNAGIDGKTFEPSLPKFARY